jgi:hypothetical protein
MENNMISLVIFLFAIVEAQAGPQDLAWQTRIHDASGEPISGVMSVELRVFGEAENGGQLTTPVVGDTEVDTGVNVQADGARWRSMNEHCAGI